MAAMMGRQDGRHIATIMTAKIAAIIAAMMGLANDWRLTTLRVVEESIRLRFSINQTSSTGSPPSFHSLKSLIAIELHRRDSVGARMLRILAPSESRVINRTRK